MNTNRTLMLASGALMTWLLAAACGGPEAPVKSPADLPSASAPEMPANPPATSAPASAASPTPTPSTPVAGLAGTGAATSTGPEPPAERVGAPLVLRLTGPDPVPTKGEIKLELEIVSREPINIPVTLKIAVPKGVTLATGKADEVLQLPQAGTIRREFLVRTTAALTTPIIITADTTAPSGGAGMHAEKKYPAAAASPTPASTGPKPPVPRPPTPPR